MRAATDQKRCLMTRAQDNREEREARADQILDRAIRQADHSSPIQRRPSEQPDKQDQPKSPLPRPSDER